MEEQRRASERLFGDIMDFSGGSVRGADRDRALAGIQWMNEAFEALLADLLTRDFRFGHGTLPPGPVAVP